MKAGEALGGRRAGVSGVREAAAVFALFLLVSFLFFGHWVIADLDSKTIGVGQDPPIVMWALKWWPQSIIEGWDPLHAHVVYAHPGLETAWITAMPGPSFLLAPLTQTAGPVVTYNVLVFLAPALNGLVAFLLCRSLGARLWPSVAGGYLFGFSSYVIAQSAGHANLVLVACIPLAFYLAVRRFSGTLSPRAFVVFLSATLTFQFLTSTEIFLTLTLFGLLILLLSLAAFPDQRQALWSDAKLVLLAYVIAALLVSPYLLPSLGATGELRGNAAIPTDPLNFLIPTKLTAVGGNSLEPVSSRFAFADPVPWEQGSYLGLPLLLIAVLFWRERRDRFATVLVIATLAILIASLGSRLSVLGADRTLLRLPWDLFAHLPVFKYVIPIRLMVYAWLLIAVMAALWLSRGSQKRWLLGGLAIVFLLPNPFATVAGSDVQTVAGTAPSPWSWPRSVPQFFKDPQQRAVLHRHGPVVVLPYHYLGDSVLWQAEANMSFPMAGGFLSTTVPEEYSCWSIFKPLATGDYRADLRDDFLAFLRAKGVGAVLAPEDYVTTASPLLGGLPGEHRDLGGMRVYLLPQAFRRHPDPGLPPSEQLAPDPFWCPNP